MFATCGTVMAGLRGDGLPAHSIAVRGCCPRSPILGAMAGAERSALNMHPPGTTAGTSRIFWQRSLADQWEGKYNIRVSNWEG